MFKYINWDVAIQTEVMVKWEGHEEEFCFFIKNNEMVLTKNWGEAFYTTSIYLFPKKSRWKLQVQELHS